LEKNENIIIIIILFNVIMIGHNKFEKDTLLVNNEKTIYISLTGGFKNGERVDIRLLNNKGTQTVFKGKLTRQNFDGINFFDTNIITGEVNYIEISASDRKVKTKIGISIKNNTYISIDISIDNKEFDVIIFDSPGEYD